MQEKNVLTLTCEQETAEFHSSVALGWIGLKKNLTSCRISQQCGFGVDWPQKRTSKAAEFHGSVALGRTDPKEQPQSEALVLFLTLNLQYRIILTTDLILTI